MMNCRQASRLLSESLDRRLSVGHRLALRWHLLLCGACRQFSRQLTFLRMVVAYLGRRIENDQNLALSERARQRIAAAMEEDQHPHPEPDNH